MTVAQRKLDKKQRIELYAALAFLLPNFLGFLVFTAGPVVFSLLASFTNWNLMRTVPFQINGFENYALLFSDKQFWLYFLNTLYFMIGIPIGICGSLWLAVLLNTKFRGLMAYRTLLYLPSFTSGVAIMILWKALFNPDFGPINAIWDAFFGFFSLSIEAPLWLLSTNNLIGIDVDQVRLTITQVGLGARDAIIIMGLMTGIGGGNMLLYLAALTNVPEELTEAAQLDGAGRWATFRNIVWPQLAPTTFFIVVMSMIGGFQGGFEQARVMTGGGPAGTTTTLSYFIYSAAFERFEIGYASAVSWVLFAIIFVVTLLNWKFGNRETSYT